MQVENIIQKPIPYGKQNITQEDVDAVVKALHSDFMTQGPTVGQFEEAFAGYVGATYAIALANGTAALHLCALALGVDQNTRVITSPNTFVASANCIRYCGGQVDFADIDPVTYCLDIEAVRKKLQDKPAGYYSGLIPVDFAGYPVDLKAWRTLADEFGLWIIEDACHAPGAKSLSHTAGDGQYADLAIFSFHPVKHIATGEGGMITTRRKDLNDKLLMLRTHGITKDPALLSENPGGWYYEMQTLGYNYRITDLQCALGISQLGRAPEGLKRRQEIATIYNSAFAGIEAIQTPSVVDTVQHAYHLYVVQVENRKGLYDHLKSKNIFPQVHYIPVHLQPYYKSLGWQGGDFPFAEQYYSRCLSLPVYPTLSEAEQKYVIDTILAFLD